MRYEATEACLVDFSYHLWPLLLRNILTIVMISVFEDKGCVFSCNTCYMPSYPYESQFKATIKSRVNTAYNFLLEIFINVCKIVLVLFMRRLFKSISIITRRWFYVNVIPGELCTCINAVFNAVFYMLNTRPKIGQCDDPYIRNL